jgi:ABC-type multidrug transport system fused ATPase/permease subunit
MFRACIGKSTCISLLLRFYEPLLGQISINDRPIEEYTIKQLRQNIGVVSQEPVCLFQIFSFSVHNQIF